MHAVRQADDHKGEIGRNRGDTHLFAAAAAVHARVRTFRVRVRVCACMLFE